MTVTDAYLRTPLRPLGQILSARAKGEDPRAIERENIKRRHNHTKEGVRLRAQGRLLVLGIMFLCLFAAITLRIGLLAASEPSEPKSQRAGASIIAQRADIVDRRGRILATNMDTHSLYIETDHLVDPEGTANALAEVFRDLDATSLFEDFTGTRKFLWIKRKMSPEQVQAAHDIGDPGLRFGPREMRLYPNRHLAAHVLGGASFGREGVHAAEVVGVAGVEKTFDERLRDPAQSGQAMQLSIDLSVQAAVEQVLEGGMKLLNAKGAAAILMDVHSGELIALTSLPDFDPNNRPRPPVQREAADSPLFNRAIQGVYELGSTFKILTVAQALELDLVTPETIVDIRGPIRWGKKFTISDFHYYGKELSVSDIITKSSNIGTARIASMIGGTAQQNFLGSLGFLETIPLEMVEASGGKPLAPAKWSDLSTMTISYGHGLSATPLHLAVGYAAIANGGLKVTPTLLKGKPKAEPPRVLSADVAADSLQMLRNVVTMGTASMAEVSGYAVAGKTGTADKPVKGGYDTDKVIATFASVFPAYAPKFVLVVALDEPEDRTGNEPRRTAGWTAVPVSAEIIRRIAPLLGLVPQFEN